MKNKSAVVLLSGGLDSAVVLSLAKKQGFESYCLIFDYGQRHSKEINAAKAIARQAKCRIQTVKIALPWKGSALLDQRTAVPEINKPKVKVKGSGIPNTYVPGRNIIFLSFAISFAEAISAQAVFIGAHAQDYSGYPDCRPEFYRAFARVVSCGTKAGVENKPIRIIAPLLKMSKAQIIIAGRKLKVPFGLTWSCYKGGKAPCGVCESCYYRAKGFKEAGVSDPALK